MSMSKNFKLFGVEVGGTGISKITGLFLHSTLQREVIRKVAELSEWH